MTVESFDISVLSTGQRVALMERLWRSLAADVEVAGPPAWHEGELDKRAGEWENRHEVAENWSAVREELRKELP